MTRIEGGRYDVWTFKIQSVVFLLTSVGIHVYEARWICKILGVGLTNHIRRYDRGHGLCFMHSDALLTIVSSSLAVEQLNNVAGCRVH